MSEAALMPEDDGQILFEEGIIGVPRARRFQILEREGSNVRVLRCLDIEGFALPIVDPKAADPAYRPELGPRITEAVSLEAGEPALLFAVATLEPDGPKANLRAPIVINARKRLAAQVILEDRSYPLRAPVR